ICWSPQVVAVVVRSLTAVRRAVGACERIVRALLAAGVAASACEHKRSLVAYRFSKTAVFSRRFCPL
ncbi:MAG: hypothetical protein II297_03040, partial [Clostridia bacterium]|nr:hypothetical protein [Clostridia bacterium]